MAQVMLGDLVEAVDLHRVPLIVLHPLEGARLVEVEQGVLVVVRGMQFTGPARPEERVVIEREG